jgi:hypothetical protein
MAKDYEAVRQLYIFNHRDQKQGHRPAPAARASNPVARQNPADVRQPVN